MGSSNGIFKKKNLRKSGNVQTFLQDWRLPLMDYHYPLRSPEEVFNKLNGGKVFSKIVLSEAYIQISGEENSSLTTLY